MHALPIRACGRRGLRTAWLLGSALAPVVVGLTAPASALAQSSTTQTKEVEEIIVTGTQIRGVAPVGTNVLSIGDADIVATGAQTANEVLATVPQVTSNFNQIRALPAVSSGLTNLAPSIRNVGSLPGAAASSGATTTLVLMDGHRMVNAGVLSTSPDPDVLPPGALERVEVMPDGGSSIYGSDAVGGVINFISRKRFSGFEIVAHGGVGDHFSTFDTNATAGSDWGSGSAYISYDYQHNEPIYARDRSFIHQLTANNGSCGAGTVFVGSTPYALPARTPNTITTCDVNANSTYYPKGTRHSVFARIDQDLTSSVNFDMTAFYTARKSVGRVDPVSNNFTATICNPAIVSTAACSAAGGVPFAGYVPVSGDTGVQRVAFNFGNLVNTNQPNDLQEFQVTPTITAQLNGNWQLRVLGAYGESTVKGDQYQLGGGIPAAIAAGNLNPYNPAAINTTILPTLLSHFLGNGTQYMTNFRGIADGKLFHISGGDVRVAVGAEYRREGLRDVVFGAFTPGAESTAKPISSSRDVKSVFGEVEVPLVGPDNAMSMVQSLVLSVSARYDDYSDFGGTFDPKVGITYKPVDWLNVRANWGQSFDAPSLADTHAPDTRAFNIPAFVLTKPGLPANGFTQQLAVIVGGNPGLQPQKADTWSIGADISPPPIPGLKASITYYNIALTDQIAIPPISQQIYTAAYSAFAQVPGPPLATLTSFLAANGAPWVGTIAPQDLYILPGGLYSFLDFRRHNLGDVHQSGIDFDVRYRMPTSFGAVTATVGGTYSLDWKIAAVSGAPFTSVLDSPGASRFSMVSSLGAEWGNLTGTLFWYHTEGFDISPPLASAGFPTPQTHVGGFDTFNLFVQWDVKGKDLLKDLSLTLNVDNLFDADPPFYNGSGFGTLSGYAPNTGTLGRVVTLGVRKRF